MIIWELRSHLYRSETNNEWWNCEHWPDTLCFLARARESSSHRVAFRSGPKLRHRWGSIAWIGDSSSSWSLTKCFWNRTSLVSKWLLRRLVLCIGFNNWINSSTASLPLYNVTVLIRPRRQPIMKCHVSNVIKTLWRETSFIQIFCGRSLIFFFNFCETNIYLVPLFFFSDSVKTKKKYYSFKNIVITWFYKMKKFFYFASNFPCKRKME